MFVYVTQKVQLMLKVVILSFIEHILDIESVNHLVDLLHVLVSEVLILLMTKLFNMLIKVAKAFLTSHTIF